MESHDGSKGKPGRPSKVARLIEEYDLDKVGDELEAAWTADGDQRQSLRDLADRFNRQILRAFLENAGIQPLENEPTNIFRLLTDDEVSSAEQTRARRRLDREGIDVDALLGDFVSYQAIRTYLLDYRGVTYSDGKDEGPLSALETIQRLRGRTASVTGSKLDRLKSTGDLKGGQFRPIVDITIVCESCGGRFDITTLLNRGRCDCGKE